MLRVFETFSGIGAQAKALRNIGADFEVVATADWDIMAIIAYDFIHNGSPCLDKYEKMSREELLKRIDGLTLSNDGKKPASKSAIKALSKNTLTRLCAAIDRTNNLVSVTDIHGKDLPKGTDLLTYSFPCQDLSLAHSWHGETGGINRDAGNRSSMLWEIERILKECENGENELPKYLLMENVSAILSDKHRKNFSDWQNSLRKMGYYNKVYKLRSSNFGSVQDRERAYMISILTNNDLKIELELDKYFKENDLAKKKIKVKKPLKKILRLDYDNPIIFKEAEESCPNDTPSRRAIYENNAKLYDERGEYANIVRTVTTKQDRHPNSGVIFYKSPRIGASMFRYLTPRECLLLMGFDDDDYERIINNNFSKRDNNPNVPFFTCSKIVKMAGNSIVVDVLEEVFRQIIKIDEKVM